MIRNPNFRFMLIIALLRFLVFVTILLNPLCFAYAICQHFSSRPNPLC